MKQIRRYPTYTVTKKAEHSITAGHPWVYAEEITQLPEEIPETAPWWMFPAAGAVTWARAFSVWPAKSASGS